MPAHPTYGMIGLGGMGMAPLALYLRQRGARVLGWDDGWRDPVADLLRRGGVEILAQPAWPEGVERVVYSSAIAPSHPLRLAAAARGLPQRRRGEMLAEAAAGHRLLAVAGSHGKTTTTAMIVSALEANGCAFDYVLGGLFQDATPPARGAGHPWLVAEIDESDGTIDGFHPDLSLVVNLDWDHADFYRSPEAITDAFRRLFARTRGSVLLPSGQSYLSDLARSAGRTDVFTFGAGGDFSGEIVAHQAHGLALQLSGRFPALRAEVRAGGEFNARNALGALAATTLLHGTVRRDSLARFPGVRRRQNRLVDTPELTVIQDYAHHPTEIEALLRYARTVYPERRLTAVFQPHRYSRTARFREEFARVLATADRLCLLEVYAASEQPLPGGRAADILAHLPAGLPARVAGHPGELRAWLDEGRDQPSTVLFIGAGDIEEWAEDFGAAVHEAGLAATASATATSGPAPRPPSSPGTWWDELSGRLGPASRLARDESLARKTTLGVGGPARYYAEPADPDDLALVLRAAREVGVPVFVLGRGSNLLVPDEGYDGLVVRLAGDLWREVRPLDGLRLWAGAGARLKEVCAAAARLGLAGLEFLEGIPGTVGGALRMNAGALGGWTAERVASVHLLDRAGQLRVVDRAGLGAGYRHCAALEEGIALGAILEATERADPDLVRSRLEAAAARRRASQPRDPSAGCIFRNPPGDHAGRLIDSAGLKGVAVGGAQVSPVHANFLVNTGDATAADFLALIRQVQGAVEARTGIALEPEVILLGKRWEDFP